MFRKKEIHTEPGLFDTNRASRMMEVRKTPSLDLNQDEGFAEPGFEKVQKMVLSHVPTRQLAYLKALCELWHAVNTAGINVEKVLVFDGPEGIYDRVRLICGSWLPFPAMPRPVLSSRITICCTSVEGFGS